MKKGLIIILLLVGLGIASAQNISQYQQEISSLVTDFQAGRITAVEMENRSSTIAANINSGNIRQDARNDIQWRREWITLLTEMEQYLDNFYKTQSVPYTLFYSNNIRQGAINYQNETIALSIETYLQANETWLLPVQRVVQAIYNGLTKTERSMVWGLNNWPWTSVTTLTPFSGRRSKYFTIVTELVNDQNRVIGTQTFQAESSWGWVNNFNNNIGPIIQFNNNNNYINNIVTFNVKVDDITDNLTIRVKSVNGSPADVASRDGVLSIVTNNLIGPIRYDGVYFRKEDSDSNQYIRFYDDGTVITVTSTGTITQIKNWFDKDNNSPSKGKYVITGDSIIFQSTSEAGRVDYNGKILDNKLILNIHSHINGFRASSREYIFSSW